MDPPHTAPPAMPLTKRGTRTTMGCSPQNIHLAHIFECSITYGLAHCQTQKFLRLPQRVLHWSCTQKQPFALQQCCRNRATRTNLSRLEPPILRTANPGTFQPYTPIKLTLEPCKLGNFSNVLPIQARAVRTANSPEFTAQRGFIGTGRAKNTSGSTRTSPLSLFLRNHWSIGFPYLSRFTGHLYLLVYVKTPLGMIMSTIHISKA